MNVYQIIIIALSIPLTIILGYDMKCWIEGNYKYHLLRIFVVILLAIVIIYDAKCWDDSIVQKNAKKFDQHFEIERQDELNNSFAISQKLIKELNGIGNQWIVISWKQERTKN